MKKTKWWIGLLAAIGLVSGAHGAAPQPRATDSETQGGVTWFFSLGENGAIVTGADPAAGALTVPSTLGGQPVAEIGYTAFASCDELTSLVVPAGVGNIGERAFQYCSLLEEVSLPAGVTNIGAMAFQYCDSLATLALPQSVEDIGTNALFHCDALAKLYAPWAWWNTPKTATAGIGTGCTVIYGEPGKATLIFDANGGTCDTIGRGYAPGEPYGWLPEPSRDSHSFAGWWTATNGGTRVEATDTAPSSEGWRPLYARWAPLTQEVMFNPNGGICDTTSRVYNAGEPYSPLPSATREHYDFAGWWTSTGGGANITEETLVTTNATRTLYAHWTLAEQVVTFDPNGGTCDTTGRVYSVGGKYSLLPKATREGYAFDGWFTLAKGGDRLSAASAVTAQEYRTLYAHWTLTEQLVIFNPNGGTCDTASRTYAVGETYAWLPEASRADGAAFAGWYEWTGSNWTRAVETDVVTVERSRELWAAWGGGGVDVPIHVSGFPRDGEMGGFSVEFAGTEGKTYTLQRTRKLEGAATWATVKTLEADRSGTLTMAAETPAGWDKGFYRVVEPGSGSGLPGAYLVVDLSEGCGDDATYPVSFLSGEPEGGWTDEYKTTKLVLRLIPAGMFTMGSPTNELGRSGYIYRNETQHEVTITKSFYMGVFEVTQRQWELVMGKRPSYYKAFYERRPVEEVNYNDIRGSSAGSGWPGRAEVDATCFLGRLRARTGGFAFDLPTEAQWEYACRAGTETALNSGKDLTDSWQCANMAEVGRYWYNGGKNYSGEYVDTSTGTAVVGTYRPNAWGLYDMHGNVWEWCLDWWQSNLGSEAATDPKGDASGSSRVLRGGSWKDYAEHCRSAYRSSGDPSYWSGSYGDGRYGLRLACLPGL